jgi:hypothetical protein
VTTNLQNKWTIFVLLYWHCVYLSTGSFCKLQTTAIKSLKLFNSNKCYNQRNINAIKVLRCAYLTNFDNFGKNIHTTFQGTFIDNFSHKKLNNCIESETIFVKGIRCAWHPGPAKGSYLCTRDRMEAPLVWSLWVQLICKQSRGCWKKLTRFYLWSVPLHLCFSVGGVFQAWFVQQRLARSWFSITLKGSWGSQLHQVPPWWHLLFAASVCVH